MGGMMNQRLVVADAAGVIQADSSSTTASGA